MKKFQVGQRVKNKAIDKTGTVIETSKMFSGVRVYYDSKYNGGCVCEWVSTNYLVKLKPKQKKLPTREEFKMWCADLGGVNIFMFNKLCNYLGIK